MIPRIAALAVLSLLSGAAFAASDADRDAPADALYLRAAAENGMGLYGQAAKDASRGLAQNPADPSLHDTRARAYLAQGRYAEALRDSDESLALDPRDARAFANRARAHEGLGQLNEMVTDFKRASELDPHYERAFREALQRDGIELPAQAFALSPRARSFATILLFSLSGGLLIGVGLWHVASGERAAPPPAPALEDRYALGRTIGQGGMGVVYEARDKRLGRPVAIKMLRAELSLDAEAKRAFVEEARTVAELHHPAIVDIHAVEEDSRGLYLIFERLEGRTLDQVLSERGALPLRETKRVLGLVCDALGYAHAHGVVHRDLKPANLMLTSEGGVRLLDFGISRHARDAAAPADADSVLGTPIYMAPEQEQGVVREQNDVFGLGALLYEMTTGACPFAGHAAKLAKRYKRPSFVKPELPSALDALVDAALEPDPDKRLASPAEFKAILDALPA